MYTQQLVKYSGIAQQDFRCFNLPLREVFMPRRKLAHHENIRQKIEVVAHRRLAYAERSRRLCGVPDLRVIMSEHRPEPKQRHRPHSDAKLRYVAFHERAHELLSPFVAVRI